MPHERFQECIKACDACSAACRYCATECLKEEQIKGLVKCIQLNLECAAICSAAAELMGLGSRHSYRFCQICVDICTGCAEECEQHAKRGMTHCRDCAEACHQCAGICKKMADAA